MRWQLSCGYEVEALEHDKQEELPRRPRMCPTCQKLRNVVGVVQPE
jgi:hypothetical protein